MRKWRIEDSAELYNINGWGRNYFNINEKGHVTVTPRPGCASVDLKDVMDELQVRDITAPVLLRFPDILDTRIEKISNCFAKASEQYDYKANSYLIYPIKVNQIREVVEEVVSYGKKFNIGLEAGSKPELHAVLATNIAENALIICNGYKDESYIELALLAQKMGRRIFLVVEKLNELRLIADIAKRLKIRPNIGIRIKLSSSGSGKWEESGGDQSKFGVDSSELLEALDILRRHDMSDCLRLIHFHIGSQITKIRRIKNALREATQFYVQLSKMGFNIDFIDIGGGLGVDDVDCVLSADSIMVAGSRDEVTALTKEGSINLATIDLASVRDGDELTFPVPLTDELKNLSGLTDIRVTITVKKHVVSQTFSATRIQYIHNPEGWNVDIVTKEVAVEIRGSQKLMDELTAENIRIVADLQNITQAAGQYTVPGNVRLDSEGSNAEIGAMNSNYSIVVTLTPA